MQPRSEKLFTLIGKAGPNVVESAAILTEFLPFRRSGAHGRFNTLQSVCHITIMDVKTRYKVRRVVSRGTPSYQLGHYEMTGKPGSRRSVFKVLVHLGEHATPEAALVAWREDIDRARSVGRDKTAARIEEKVRKLEGAINGEAR
jgi:hypothetical protein